MATQRDQVHEGWRANVKANTPVANYLGKCSSEKQLCVRTHTIYALVIAAGAPATGSPVVQTAPGHVHASPYCPSDGSDMSIEAT